MLSNPKQEQDPSNHHGYKENLFLNVYNFHSTSATDSQFLFYNSLKIVNKAMHVISKGIPKKNISSNVLKVVFMAQLVLGQLIRSLKEIKELFVEVILCFG